MESKSIAKITYKQYLNPKTCHFCIASVPIFSSLTKKQLEKVSLVIRLKTYAKGEIIYRTGEVSDAFHILQEGHIRIYRLAESGKEQLIRIVNPSEFTGELALFKKGNYEAYAEAITDVTVCQISHLDFQSLLAEYPSISLIMLTEISKRLGTSEQQSTWFTTETVRSRLAHFLISQINSTATQPIVDLPMCKKDLASYLGTTPESISREFSKFEKQQSILEISHTCFKILNVDALLSF